MNPIDNPEQIQAEDDVIALLKRPDMIWMTPQERSRQIADRQAAFARRVRENSSVTP